MRNHNFLKINFCPKDFAANKIYVILFDNFKNNILYKIL